MEVQTRSTGYIWQKIFKDIILQTEADSQWFWIVDGLGECEPTERGLFMRLLTQIEGSQTPVKVLIVSRWETDIANIAVQLRERIRVDEITPDNNEEDIRGFIEARLQTTKSWRSSSKNARSDLHRGKWRVPLGESGLGYGR